MVHGGQMLLPQGVENLQHDLLLEQAHLVPHLRALGRVLLFEGGFDLVLQFGLLQRLVLVEPGAERQAGAEFGFDGAFEAFEVPLLGDALGRDVAVDNLAHDLFAHAAEQLRDILVAHQLVALAVDDRALVVGDIVILKQLLSYIEVAAFHLALGFFDRARDHAGLDGLAALHAEAAHEILHALAGEDAHQIVFHRQVEARIAWIALAPGAAAELVVDAARFVAFGADDMQAAGFDNLIVAFLPIFADPLDPRLVRRFVR